jgi:voltage-gated sodium channel
MKILRALACETAVITGIVLSTVAMFALGFTAPDSTAYKVWLAIDIACVVYFVAEACAKVALCGWREYWAVRWNRFDFLIVALSLPVLVSPFAHEYAGFVGVPVLRMARLFRLFRLLRFIPGRARLGAGVVRALRASVGVFLAIMIVNFIFAMGAHILFDQIAPDYFGNPARACYSMFRIFTIEGWHDIPEAIERNASDGWVVVARIYFGAAVLIGGILGLSLGNAVFVDQMMADNTRDVERDVAVLTTEVRALRDEIRALRGEIGARADPAPPPT